MRVVRSCPVGYVPCEKAQHAHAELDDQAVGAVKELIVAVCVEEDAGD
jgi:hypothetical protein